MAAGGIGPTKASRPLRRPPAGQRRPQADAARHPARDPAQPRIHASSRATTSGHSGTVSRTRRCPSRPQRLAASRSDHSRSNAAAIALGLGVVTSPDSASRTNSSGPPLSVSVTTGRRGRERLDRDVAVVLVVRTEEDAERASIELVQPFVRHADLEPDLVLEPVRRGCSSGATARRDHARRARA